MATCFDYVRIAFASYYSGCGQYYDDPPGHMIDGWTVQHWQGGGLFGHAFQGGIWQSDTDVVVGCCGTNTKSKGKMFRDLLDDMRVGLRILPNQSTAASKMVEKAKSIARGRTVSITGHSLGGGLAQVAGVWEGIPFVTFNAPAMKSVIKASRYNLLKPHMMAKTRYAKSSIEAAGINFRIRGLGPDGYVKDIVSTQGVMAGDHVGMTIDLAPKTCGGAHAKTTCWQAVFESPFADVNPFIKAC